MKKQGYILATLWLLLVMHEVLAQAKGDELSQAQESLEVTENDIPLDYEDPEASWEDGNTEGVNNSTFNYQDSAVRNMRKLWINKVVPYDFDSRLTYSYRRNIKSAIAEYHSKTCIKFVKRTNEKHWLRFKRGPKCFTSIGRRTNPGFQKIYLAPHCNFKHVVMHEMMHTLGFWHEISRPDRDQYVEIMWENIAKKSERNFKKHTVETINTMGIMYDYNSLLHYFSTAFSINGKPTIRPLKKLKKEMGRAKTFSKLDLIKLNALYDCRGKLGGWSSWSRFGPCDNNCNKYRQRFCYSKNRARDCPLVDRYGIGTETRKCSRRQCHAPVNGIWSRWSDWSKCSTLCGWGSRTRTRQCNDPSPQNGGRGCAGKNTQLETCNMETRGPVYYRFMVYNPRHNQCLSYRGNRVVIETCDRKYEGQSWAWSAYDQLVNIKTGDCLDSTVQNKGPIKLNKCCKGKPGQQWTCSGNMVRPGKANLNLNYGKNTRAMRLYSGRGLNSQWKILNGKNGNICSQKPVCKVKTEKNGCCVFPFKYLGKVHHSCAISIYSGKPWCATSPKYPMERKWGYCETKPKVCKVKTNEGKCCVFPFKYRKKWYKSCTTSYFGNKLWCSTTSNYDKDRKWGIC